MRIRLDPNGDRPLSAQLRDGIAARVVSGRLAPGERVPAVRALAAELDLAPNTVAKAYRELESAGYLVAQGRRGTFVCDVLPERPADEHAALAAAARVFARRARQLDVDPDRALAAVRMVIREAP